MTGGWQRGPLIDFAELVSTGPFGSMLHKSDYVSDGVPLINPTNIVGESILPNGDKQVGVEALSRLSSYVLKAGDVVVGRRGEIGRCAVVGAYEAGWVCGTGCFFIRPGSAADPHFLAWLLRSPDYRDQLERASTGATMKNMSNTTLAQLPVAIPEVGEQRRIVAILDEAFEAIATARANAERNLRKARELFDSALDSALSNQTGSFIETNLGAEIDLLAGYAFSSQGYASEADGIRLLRGDNIMQGYLRWEDAKYWPAHDAGAHARFALKQGDVVLAMDRPWVKAGLKRARISANDLPCLQLQRTARLRPKQRMGVDFLFHLTGSNLFSQHLLSVQTGIGVPHISGKQIESFQFRLPSLDEQEAIAVRLHDLQRDCERLSLIYQQKANALDELKKSLLHQAFTGQL